MPFHSLKKVQLSHGKSNDIALGEVCQGMANSLSAFQCFAFVAQIKFAPFL